MIDSTHAAKRMAQLSTYCLWLVTQHEEEAEAEQKEAAEMGLQVDLKPVVVKSRTESVWTRPHQWIQFYSKFL